MLGRVQEAGGYRARSYKSDAAGCVWQLDTLQGLSRVPVSVGMDRRLVASGLSHMRQTQLGTSGLYIFRKRVPDFGL